MKRDKLFYKECHLAGREYHDANEVWDELHIGLLLDLERETDNRFDPDAVAVVYHRNEDEKFLLGYIPRTENATIAALLEMGWQDAFECRISRISENVHYEQQIRLTIRIVRNENRKRQGEE